MKRYGSTGSSSVYGRRSPPCRTAAAVARPRQAAAPSPESSEERSSNLECLHAARLGDRPSLASMLKMGPSDLGGNPNQVVIRFPGSILSQQLGREEGASLAEIGRLVKGKDELVGD